MKRITALLLVLLMLLSVTGCKQESEVPALTDAQAEQILSSLLPLSNQLMQVCYGKGLDYVKPDSVLEYDGVQYEPVKEGQLYSSISAIRADMAKVFTKSYQKELAVTMFEGYEMPDQTTEEGQELLDEIILPRYREQEGVLQIDIKYKSFDLTDFPTHVGAKVVKGNATRVTVQLSYEKDGSDTTRVTLRLENGVWLLDGPSY